MVEHFCHTCNSKQDCTEDNSYGVEFFCKRCGSDTGQLPFNLSKWYLCGCTEPNITNEYVNSTCEPEDDMVFVNFKAKCEHCNKEWKWRGWVSFDLKVFG